MPVPSDILRPLDDPPRDSATDVVPDYSLDDFSDLRRETAQAEGCDESHAAELLAFIWHRDNRRSRGDRCLDPVLPSASLGRGSP